MLLKEERRKKYISLESKAVKKWRLGRGEGTMLANMKPLEKQWLPPNMVGLRASFDTTRDKSFRAEVVQRLSSRSFVSYELFFNDGAFCKGKGDSACRHDRQHSPKAAACKYDRCSENVCPPGQGSCAAVGWEESVQKEHVFEKEKEGRKRLLLSLTKPYQALTPLLKLQFQT